MIRFYDVTQSALNSTNGKTFRSEALYLCSDTGKIFLDSKLSNTRVEIGCDIKIIAKETDRENLLAPIPEKIYCVLESGRMYIYTSSTWLAIGGGGQIIKRGLTVTKGKSITVSDAGIKATNTGVFTPDLSVEDLASDISVVCANGSATISLTSDYDIIGDLVIS